MGKVFVNIALSLDGFMAPEGMTLEHWGDPGHKSWGAKWGALMNWLLSQHYMRDRLGFGPGGETGAAPSVSYSREEARRCPDVGVASVLVPPDPGHSVDPLQAVVSDARLYRALADGLAVKMRHQAAGRFRVRTPAIGLEAKSLGADLRMVRLECFPRPQLVALTFALGAFTVRSEDRPKVVAAGQVGGND